jgi:hypothetical protein
MKSTTTIAQNIRSQSITGASIPKIRGLYETVPTHAKMGTRRTTGLGRRPSRGRADGDHTTSFHSPRGVQSHDRLVLFDPERLVGLAINSSDVKGDEDKVRQE